MPTLKEREALIRRCSVGRMIAEICMDLGATPSTCEGGFWNQIDQTTTDFGGKFEDFFAVKERRREAFQKERDLRLAGPAQGDHQPITRTPARGVPAARASDPTGARRLVVAVL